MDIRGIAFIVTYRCNLSCAHCFFAAGSTDAHLSAAMLEQALNSAPYPFPWLHFTGGEPLLDPQHLLELLKTARKYHDGDIGIATNGYWGKNPQTARDLVLQLKELGVSGVTLSVDSFHQPALSLETVRSAARAVAEAGLNRHSWLVACRHVARENGEENQATMTAVRKLSEETGIPVAETEVRSIGRGASQGIAQAEEKSCLASIPQGPCRDLACCLGESGPFDPRMIWVDPHGNVMICYGLTIGSLRHSSLEQILSAYDPLSHPLLEALARQGPKGLYALARERCVAPDGGRFLDECDLCFRSRRALQAHFPEVLTPQECYP